jgi:hypothetical protein
MMLRRRSPLRRSVAAPALRIPNAPAGAALFSQVPPGRPSPPRRNCNRYADRSGADGLTLGEMISKNHIR